MVKKKEFAGFGMRTFAFLIDFFVLITGQRLLNLIFQGSLRRSFSFLWFFGYAPLMTYQYQATLGKMALKLKVISEDGKKLEVFQVLLREWIGKLLSFVCFFLGFVWAGIDEKKQAWHDRLARTLVVKASHQ